MNFFEHQARARRQTRRLVWLFALAACAVIVVINVLAIGVHLLLFSSGPFNGWIDALQRLPTGFVLTNTAVATLFMVGSAVVELSRLEAGGEAVAAMLGARRLEGPHADAHEKRLLNVAEELSIAAGAPVPRVYVLDDELSINACATGLDPRDAIVIVTRGALLKLERSELQGVFAHELSHILHGDILLNLRLIGYVQGILMVHHYGMDLLSAGVDTRGLMRRGDPHGSPLGAWVGRLMVPFALALLVAGAAGWIAARWLQAAASREREFHADATAVRFTRQPDGIGNALRRVQALEQRGAPTMGGRTAGLLAHAWLLPLQGKLEWWSTHPPIAERIRRIFGRTMPALEVTEDDPMTLPAHAADEASLREDAPIAYEPVSLATLQQSSSSFLSAAGGFDVAPAIDRWQVPFADACEAARDPQRAASVVLALFGRAGGSAHMATLTDWTILEPMHWAEIQRWFERLGKLDDAACHALLEIGGHTLGALPIDRRAALMHMAKSLIADDERVTPIEYAMFLILRQRLGFGTSAAGVLRPITRAHASPSLAVLIQGIVGWTQPSGTQGAAAGGPVVSAPAPEDCLARAAALWGHRLPAQAQRLSSSQIELAIRTIARLRPLDMALAIRSLVAACETSDQLSASRAALLRALCAVWSVPVPPPIALRPEVLDLIEQRGDAGALVF